MSLIVKSALMLAVAAATSLTTVLAADAARTKQAWQQALRHIDNDNDFNKLPATATVAMACTKCKSVTIMTKRDIVAGKPAHGQKEVTITAMSCPGCGGTLTRKPGTKEAQWAYSCSKCGDDSAFCCASGERSS